MFNQGRSNLLKEYNKNVVQKDDQTLSLFSGEQGNKSIESNW
jgi:hypothetical protein